MTPRQEAERMVEQAQGIYGIACARCGEGLRKDAVPKAIALTKAVSALVSAAVAEGRR